MQKIYKQHWPILVISVFCLVLIATLFKDHKFLATGEEGLVLAKPDRAIELYKYSWNEIGVGESYPGVNVMIPLLYIESLAVNDGMPLWLFQAVLFYTMILIGSGSMFYLTKRLFLNLVKKDYLTKIAFIAAIFYILNPVSLLGVWYRFAHSFMMFYALVPFFFYLFLLGLDKKRFILITILPLLTIPFSFVFSSPALPPLIWVFPFGYSIIVFRQDYKKNHKILSFPLVYFISMFIYWILINIWWIVPYIVLSQVAFSSETDTVHAIGTLKANSSYYSLGNVIRLIHGGFLYTNETFGKIYKTLPYQLLSWLLPVFTIYGMLKLKSGIIKKFLLTNLLILLFIVKGTQPPLGGVYLWLFKHAIFLQVYRNTFEKIGMILPTIYAPLFSSGLVLFLSRIRNPKKRNVLLLFSLVCLGAYNWPFFTGALVHYKQRDIRVEVPSTFETINQNIPEGDHIMLSLPIMGGASGFYKWEFGYKGVDASEYLFKFPTITKFYDASTFYGKLLIAESHGELDNNLVGLAQLFSVDYIVVRHDTDLAAFGYNLDALDRVNKMILSSGLTKIYDSKLVSIWSLPKEKQIPIIYTPASIRLVDSPEEIIAALSKNNYDPKKETFICVNPKNCKPALDNTNTEIPINGIPEQIEIKKISPVSYNMIIRNPKGNFLLVFNNSYNPGWELKVNDKVLASKRHFVANGYANGFSIEDKGDLMVKLYFRPEQTLSRSLYISKIAITLSLIILFGYLIYSIARLNSPSK